MYGKVFAPPGGNVVHGVMLPPPDRSPSTRSTSRSWHRFTCAVWCQVGSGGIPGCRRGSESDSRGLVSQDRHPKQLLNLELGGLGSKRRPPPPNSNHFLKNIWEFGFRTLFTQVFVQTRLPLFDESCQLLEANKSM